MKKLFVGNCDFGVDETALQDFIEQQGVQVTTVKIIRDRDTNRSRGFGFVELEENQDLDQAIDTLNGKELEGRALTVNLAKERSGGGGGFNRGGPRRGGGGGGFNRGGPRRGGGGDRNGNRW